MFKILLKHATHRNIGLNQPLHWLLNQNAFLLETMYSIIVGVLSVTAYTTTFEVK